MSNGFNFKHLYWRWQPNIDSNNWFGVAYLSTGCWIFDSKYGKEGPLIWKSRKPGKLIIVSHKTKLKYTNLIELFARNCKIKINEKYFARKYYLIPVIESKLDLVNNIYSYLLIINKFNLNSDVIRYISSYIKPYSIDIDKYVS